MWEFITQRRCRQVATVLQRYLDGELDLPTAQRVHEHLEVCRRCGLDARTYRAIKVAIPVAHAEVAEIAVDPEAIDRLRAFARSLGGDPSEADEG